MKFQRLLLELTSNPKPILNTRPTRNIFRHWNTKFSFVFITVLGLSLAPTVHTHTNDRNWKTTANDPATSVQRATSDSYLYKDAPALKGGTKWASASQEAYDELHDTEILRAVQQSIAEWQERRHIRDAKNHSSITDRFKRSQPEKSNAYLDADADNKEPTQVCYSDLGCFEEAGYIDLLPNSPEEVNTRYLLYNSRRSRGDTPLLDVSAQNISSLWEWVGKAFNVSAPTKVIVHGFGSSCSNVWVYEMRSALMSVEDCNIICVDWENGATIPNYVRAAANTRLVGKQVAILLSGLEKYVKLSLRNVHVIGFSLGAHVAGFAGSELKNLSRITGLDPAGPLFESQDRRARLDSMDAQFVDVIHSNGENLILGGLGAWQPMGHVDFYPNGGRMQKGCTNLFVGAVSDMIWSANEVYGRSLCNHRRAYKFFTDSVSPKCQFPAVPCESYDHFIEGKCFPCENLKECSNMGYYANKFPGRGTLFLLTRDEEPFCANQYVVKVENSAFKEDVDKKSITFGKLQIILIGDLDLNETFTITQKKDEKLMRGESISRIIVPHPALQNFLKIQITYIAYKGWLSSGEPSWRINKISLTNSYGHILSTCKKDLELESGITVMLQLVPKDCSIHDVFDAKINYTVKPVHDGDRKDHWNQTFNNFYPHTQVIRLGNEILSLNNADLHSVLNSGLGWTNTSASLMYQHVHNNTHNTSRIGVGVAEYLNDRWKQKPDVFDSSTIGVLNNLDNINYDNGEGRRLVDLNSRNHTLAEPIPSVNQSSLNTKSTPYEFVTEHLLTPAVKLLNPPTKTGREITEPILKSKISSTTAQASSRPQKSQNNNRPTYGKSINVGRDHSIASNVKRSSTTNSTKGNAEEGNEFPDLEHSGRAFKKSVETDSKNSSTQSFVVQFLPQRLISFLEQAERYARMAFSPFISPQEGMKSGTRRVRMFNMNPWTSQKETNDRQDMDVEGSQNAALSISGPTKFYPTFPYPFHMPRQLNWQPISRYPVTPRKYIPLTSQESKVLLSNNEKI